MWFCLCLCLSLCFFGCSKGHDVSLKDLYLVFLDKNKEQLGVGYSLCVERVSEFDDFCSDSILLDQVYKDSKIDLSLKSLCTQGYRLKLWTWTHPELRRAPQYGLRSDYLTQTNNYDEEGYLLIDKSMLEASSFNLQLKLSPVGTHNPQDDRKDINLNLIGINQDQTSIKESLLSETKASISENSQAQFLDSFGVSCNTNQPPYIPPTVFSIDGSPSGGITSVDSLPQIPTGYPTMVIYGGAICHFCDVLKEYILERSSQFKKRMYVFYYEHEGSTAHTSIVSRPLVEFYNSEAIYHGFFLGFEPSRTENLKQNFKELTGQDLN